MSDSARGLCTEEKFYSDIISSMKQDRADIAEVINQRRDLYQRTIGVLCEASTDIRQWIRLARKQRENIPTNSHVCPTQAGIDASTRVLEMIGEVCADIEAQINVGKGGRH